MPHLYHVHGPGTSVGGRAGSAAPFTSHQRRCRVHKCSSHPAAKATSAPDAQTASGGTSRPTLPRPPVAPGLPVIGHTLQLIQNGVGGAPFDYLALRWRREAGPVYTFQIPGGLPVAVISEADAIREVLEVHNYPKSPYYMITEPLLGPSSMLLTEGQAWREQRSAFNPGFSSSFLRRLQPAFAAQTRNLLAVLDQAADSGAEVKVHQLATLLTLEIICKVAFGEQLAFLGTSAPSPLYEAFMGVLRDVAFYLDNVQWYRLRNLPWNKERTRLLRERYEQELMAILERRLDQLRQQPLAEPARQGQQAQQQAGGSASGCPVHAAAGAASAPAAAGAASAPAAGGCPVHATHDSSAEDEEEEGQVQDILSLALQLSMSTPPGAAAAAAPQHASTSSSVSASSAAAGAAAGVDLDVVISQMKTFFGAGHDTTASLIAWALYFLSQHPDVEERLVAEVRQVLAGAEEPSNEHLARLRYTTAVLKETLRLRPPTNFARVAPDGERVELAGYDVSGCILLVSPYVMHQDTGIWGPDASSFRPERWLDEAYMAQVPQYAYLPFSRGPRDCIGQRFAYLEAKTILAMVLARFSFRYARQGQQEEVALSITNRPKYGVPMTVVRRQQ